MENNIFVRIKGKLIIKEQGKDKLEWVWLVKQVVYEAYLICFSINPDLPIP